MAFISQNLNAGLCILSLAVTKQHVSYHLTSGTFGLQEAINDATAFGGGNVVVDTRWRGTTAMITGATGNSSVSITDNRTGSAPYVWNGTSYVLNTGNLPVGVIAGSVCASNGIGSPCIYQTKPVIDVRDYGVVGDGITDDTTAMQAAINAMCPGNANTIGHTLRLWNSARIKISSTLLAQRCIGLIIDGQQSQGQATENLNGHATFKV